MKINIPQRIVLIIGAVVLLLIAAATPNNTFPEISSGMVFNNLFWEWKGAITKCLIISFAFAALFFGVGKRKE